MFRSFASQTEAVLRQSNIAEIQLRKMASSVMTETLSTATGVTNLAELKSRQPAETETLTRSKNVLMETQETEMVAIKTASLSKWQVAETGY